MMMRKEILCRRSREDKEDVVMKGNIDPQQLVELLRK